MFDLIKAHDLEGFLYVFQDYPEDIEEYQFNELKKKKPLIVDKLG